MTGFEFVFSLFGLILGLALAEGLGGLSKAIKARDRVRIGWPTVLLGLLVSCDVVTFWMYGWALCERLAGTWPVLFGGFAMTAVYFVSVALVFPDEPEACGDLNHHFDRQRRLVLGGVLLCNIVLFAVTYALIGLPGPTDPRALVVSYSFFPVMLLAIAVRDRRVVVGCLLWLIALYPLSAIWH